MSNTMPQSFFVIFRKVRTCNLYNKLSLLCNLFLLFIEMYVKELISGLCDGKATPTIVKETPGTGYVDGQNAIGTVTIERPS